MIQQERIQSIHGKIISWNNNFAEFSRSHYVDTYSNGFKLRAANASKNTSSTYGPFGGLG